MSPRAAIYVRVSTDEQAQPGLASLPHQEAECRKLGERLGLTVTTIHRDEVSGQTTNRPGLLRLLADLAETDAVLCYDITRLGRNRAVLSSLRQMFDDAHVSLRLVQGDTADLDDEAGPILEAVGDALSEVEVKRFVRRSRMGRVGKAQRGIWPGSGPRPYGYEVDKTAPGGLRIIEAEAEVVRGIFAGFLGGESIRGVASRLTAEGVPSYHGRPWGSSAVGGILKTPLYCGEGIYNRTQRRAGALLDRALSEWIHFKAPAIVSESTWQAAQLLLRESAKLRRRLPKQDHLLRGMIVCSDCGHAYVAQKGRTPSAVSYRHRAPQCLYRYLSARRLEPAVWEAVRSILSDPEAMLTGYRGSIAKQAERQRATSERMAWLRDRAAKLEEGKTRLLAAYADPDMAITKAEYLSQRDRLEGQLRDVTRAITELDAAAPERADPEAAASFEVFARGIGEALSRDDLLTVADRRQVLKALHCRVVVDLDGQAILEGWFGESVGVLASTSASRALRHRGLSQAHKLHNAEGLRVLPACHRWCVGCRGCAP